MLINLLLRSATAQCHQAHPSTVFTFIKSLQMTLDCNKYIRLLHKETLSEWDMYDYSKPLCITTSFLIFFEEMQYSANAVATAIV